MILIVMGVSGSGKTTLGKILAEKKSFAFQDADDFHPECNKLKMKSGVSLDDEDRWPWLKIIKDKIHEWSLHGDNVVLACSALKKSYRQLLISNTTPSTDDNEMEIGRRIKQIPLNIWFVYLKGCKETIGKQISSRRGHFMPESLLDLQFEDLEEPAFPCENCLTIPVVFGRVHEMVESILKQLKDKQCA